MGETHRENLMKNERMPPETIEETINNGRFG